MALQKKITNEVGIVTNYHRIGEFGFSKDNKTISIVMFNYVDKSYREEEEKMISVREQIESKNNEITRLMALNEDGSQLEKIKILSKEINALSEMPYARNATNSTVAYKNVIVMEFDPNKSYSMAELYDWIKQQDNYKQAKDV